MPFRRRLLFALVTVLLALLLLEGVARVAEPYVVKTTRSLPLPAPGAEKDLAMPRSSQVEMFEDDRGTWTLPPSSQRKEGNIWVRTNQYGLRGPQIGTLETGELRMLTLGDSSIFGVEVEERYVFSSVAAEDLKTRLQVPVNAYIGGVPGYDSQQALQNLQRLAPVLHLRWAVIGSLWSDVFRNDDVKQMQSRQSVREPMRAFATWRVLRWWLSPWLAAQKVRWINSRMDIGSLDNEGHPPRVILSQYLANLRAMVTTCKQNNIQPAFLMLPAPMDFDKVPPPETVMAYRAAMASVAQESGAPLLDGPALFKKTGGMNDFLDQVHPSRSGHAKLGHALAELLAPQP